MQTARCRLLGASCIKAHAFQALCVDIDTLSVVEESAIQEGQLEVGEEVTVVFFVLVSKKKNFSFSTAHY